MGARGVKSERNALRPAPKSEARAAAARERHGPHRLDLRLDPPRLEGGGDLLALPGKVGLGLHVLESAAAADPEMRADRDNAVRARCENGKQARPGRHSPRP